MLHGLLPSPRHGPREALPQFPWPLRQRFLAAATFRPGRTYRVLAGDCETLLPITGCPS